MVIVLRVKYTVFSVFCLLIILLLIFLFYLQSKNNITHETYILKSVNNVVGLYKNEELINVYENISINTLPLTDKDNLLSGIKLNSLDEVTAIIEDLDG